MYTYTIHSAQAKTINGVEAVSNVSFTMQDSAHTAVTDPIRRTNIDLDLSDIGSASFIPVQRDASGNITAPTVTDLANFVEANLKAVPYDDTQSLYDYYDQGIQAELANPPTPAPAPQPYTVAGMTSQEPTP